MQRTKLHIGKGEHEVFLLPEDMTGAELKSWARKNKIPMMRRKIKRTKFPKGEVIKKKEKKFRLVAQYIKGNGDMKRTKFPNHED